MKSLHFIAAIAADLDRADPTVYQPDLAAFELRCRRIHVVELGHLMFTAPTLDHRRIAERVATERLAANHERRCDAMRMREAATRAGLASIFSDRLDRGKAYLLQDFVGLGGGECVVIGTGPNDADRMRMAKRYASRRRRKRRARARYRRGVESIRPRRRA